MKRLLYLTYSDITTNEMLGVRKKILAQADAMRQLHPTLEVTVAFRSGSELVLQDLSTGEEIRHSLRRGVTRYKASIVDCLKKTDASRQFDAVWLRCPFFVDPTVLQLARYFDEAKFYVEVPTYPIEGELKVVLRELRRDRNYVEWVVKCLNYVLHRACAPFLARRVTALVTYTASPIVFGKNAVRLCNGVDLRGAKVPAARKATSRMEFVAVANLSTWNGYDRVIRGMAEMLGDADLSVSLTIVGDGSELNNLKQLAESCGVADRVVFAGPQSGADLEAICSGADAAIGSLALHRIGVHEASPLKSREYCLAGLPFVYSYTDPDLDGNFPWALRIDSDDSPIDMRAVVGFVEKVQSDSEYATKMYQYAANNLAWNTQLAKVMKV